MTENIDITKLVNLYFEATQSNNTSIWASCFAPNATADDPVGSPPIQGTDAILERGKESMTKFETVGLYSEYVSVDNLRAAAKWTGRGVAKDGRSLKFEGINFFQFDKTGKIVNLIGFWNPADMVKVRS
jgi:steroid Delta-isomerase